MNYYATLTVVNSTIAYNQRTGNGSGGGILDFGVPVTLDNTIVVENTEGTGLFTPPDDLSQAGGGSFTGADNLVGDDETGALSSSDNLLGVTDPGMGLLANNGGPTHLRPTMHSSGSRIS